MSAADPAGPPPARMNGGDGATVLDFSQRASAHTTRGRWEPVGHPGRDRHNDPPADGGTDSRAQQMLAEHIETTFNTERLTLSNDDTKDAFLVTLSVVRGILSSAQERGIIDEGQQRELDALIAGMLAVPRLI